MAFIFSFIIFTHLFVYYSWFFSNLYILLTHVFFHLFLLLTHIFFYSFILVSLSLRFHIQCTFFFPWHYTSFSVALFSIMPRALLFTAASEVTYPTVALVPSLGTAHNFFVALFFSMSLRYGWSLILLWHSFLLLALHYRPRGTVL